MLPLNKHNNILKTKFESASNPVFGFVLSYDHVHICFVFIWTCRIFVWFIWVRRIYVTIIISRWIVMIFTFSDWCCCSCGSRSFSFQNILFNLSSVWGGIIVTEIKTIFWFIPIGFLLLSFYNGYRFSFSYRCFIFNWCLFIIVYKFIIKIVSVENFTLCFRFSLLFFKIWVLMFIFLIWSVELSLLSYHIPRWVLLSRFRILRLLCEWWKTSFCFYLSLNFCWVLIILINWSLITKILTWRTIWVRAVLLWHWIVSRMVWDRMLARRSLSIHMMHTWRWWSWWIKWRLTWWLVHTRSH